MKAILLRLAHEEHQTPGLLQFFNGTEKTAECRTLELPWRENRQNISSIPPGVYQVKKHTSPKFGETFHVLDVPGRSEILIHTGNFNRQTRGCILPGEKYIDIDGDGNRDVTSSAATMRKLLAAAPHTFKLRIIQL